MTCWPSCALSISCYTTFRWNNRCHSMLKYLCLVLFFIKSRIDQMQQHVLQLNTIGQVNCDWNVVSSVHLKDLVMYVRTVMLYPLYKKIFCLSWALSRGLNSSNINILTTCLPIISITMKIATFLQSEGPRNQMYNQQLPS